MHFEDKKQAKMLTAILDWIRKIPIPLIGAAILVIALYFYLFAAPSIGQVAGRAVGSWKGVTQGIEAGAEAGKEAGLSAKDIDTRIGNKMKETGKLEVMLVDLNLMDLYQQGEDYAALWNMRGEGTFTVDLTQAEVSYHPENNEIGIKIPEPVFESYLDDSTLDIVQDSQGQKAEYIRKGFNGSTVDGYEGWLNSRKEIDQKVQEEIQSMLDPARNTALFQVEQLVKSVCGRSVSVQVNFMAAEE